MPETTDTFYEALALDYLNAALLLGASACVLVEGESDLDFWKKMFSEHHFKPKFIYCTRTPCSEEASGVKQCLKFTPYASSLFWICIDSDYRYPTEDVLLARQPYLLHTYVHSIENHYAHGDRLNAVCKEACGCENRLFDFKAFQQAYSENLYPLFLWLIEHWVHALSGWQPSDVLQCINESYEGIGRRNAQEFATLILGKLKKEVKRQTENLTKTYPARQPEARRSRLSALGITPQNTLLYIRGHNVRWLMEAVGAAVVDDLLKAEKEKLGKDTEAIQALYRKKKNLRSIFTEPALRLTYPEIRQLSDDIRNMLRELPEKGVEKDAEKDAEKGAEKDAEKGAEKEKD